MKQEEPQRGGPLGLLALWRKILPIEAAASSNRLGWVGLEAERFRATPAFELNLPPLPTTSSSFIPGRRRNWTCGLRG